MSSSGPDINHDVLIARDADMASRIFGKNVAFRADLNKISDGDIHSLTQFLAF